MLGDEVLLHDLIQLVLRISAQLVQGVPKFHFSSEMIDLPNYTWVGHICNCLIDQELLGGTMPELPPFGCGHGGVVVGLSTNVDGDGVLGIASAYSASDICIVSIILYVLGDLGATFKVPFPIVGIGDME